MARCSMLIVPPALGIGAASFWSAAEKDIAESPTAERSGAGTPKEKKTTSQQDYMTTSCWGDVVLT